MKKCVMGVAFSLLAFSGTAMAQNGFYGGISVGGAFFGNQASQTANALQSAVGGSGSVSNTSVTSMFRIFGGYSFSPQLALELGYLRTGNDTVNFSGVPSIGGSYSGSASVHIQGIDVSAIYHPVASGAWNGLFLRGGINHYSADGSANVTMSSGTVTSSLSTSTSTSGVGETFGIGYDLQLGPGKLRAEFDHAFNAGGSNGGAFNELQVGYYFP